MRVVVGTWNLEGIDVSKHKNLSEWLTKVPRKGLQKAAGFDNNNDDSLADMFVIGLQEIVPLNIISAVKKKTHTDAAEEWEKKLQQTLSKTGNFVLLASENMYGIALYIFVKQEYVSHISEMSTKTVGSGVLNAFGNKGAVGIRFKYKGSSMAFVNCQFASGAGTSNLSSRNEDYWDIDKNMNFKEDGALSQHEYVVFLGDMNYRMNGDGESIRKQIKNKNWWELIKYDELTDQKAKKVVFPKFNEGPLLFAPTYKYVINADVYMNDEIPSWTDRVLWHRTDLTVAKEQQHLVDQGTLLLYTKADLKSSDHRPVVAVLDLPVKNSETPSIGTLEQSDPNGVVVYNINEEPVPDPEPEPVPEQPVPEPVPQQEVNIAPEKQPPQGPIIYAQAPQQPMVVHASAQPNPQLSNGYIAADQMPPQVAPVMSCNCVYCNALSQSAQAPQVIYADGTLGSMSYPGGVQPNMMAAYGMQAPSQSPMYGQPMQANDQTQPIIYGQSGTYYQQPTQVTHNQAPYCTAIPPVAVAPQPAMQYQLMTQSTPNLYPQLPQPAVQPQPSAGQNIYASASCIPQVTHESNRYTATCNVADNKPAADRFPRQLRTRRNVSFQDDVIGEPDESDYSVEVFPTACHRQPRFRDIAGKFGAMSELRQGPDNHTGVVRATRSVNPFADTDYLVKRSSDPDDSGDYVSRGFSNGYHDDDDSEEDHDYGFVSSSTALNHNVMPKLKNSRHVSFEDDAKGNDERELAMIREARMLMSRMNIRN